MPMNKGILPLFIYTALCALALYGCSGDGDDSSVKITPIDLTAADTLIGSYQIVFFEASAAGRVLSSDCQAAFLAGSCETVYLVSGYGVINKDNETYALKTQLQLLRALLIREAPAEVYQYTAYEPVPAANITEGGININNGVAGVRGRNLLFTEDYPESSFYMTYDNAANILTVNLTVSGKKIAVSLDENGGAASCASPGDVPVTVKLRKINDTAAVMNPDALTVPGASIKEEGIIFRPYEKFAVKAQGLVCP